MQARPRSFITVLTKYLLILSLSFVSVTAQPRSVWQIGTFDQSPLEFTALPQDRLAYVVGQGDWKKDWPGTQAADTHYQIRFELQSVKGAYVLRIATLIEQPRVPALRIDVNGHSGRSYLHPSLTYYPGDASFAYHPNYSSYTVAVKITGSFLKTGENIIDLSPIDDPPSPSPQENTSSLTYDALSLDEDPAGASQSETMDVELVPTIFYRQDGSGLKEIVEAFLRPDRSIPAGDADLEIGNKHCEAKFASCELGERRVEFEVPEWSGQVAVKLHIRAGEYSKNIQRSLAPARKWTIFVVPHTHLDVGYTDYQGKVAETQARVLTQAANLIHEHPDFRFSMDASWNLQQLLATRPQSKQEEILDLIRSGKMAMPAQYCNLLTGYASLETLYRSLYESKRLARLYGLPFEYANITDVPSYSGSYPSILAASGVKYWVAAANNDRAPIFYHHHWNEKSPFWWEGPDGGKVLFWYSWAYLQVQTLFGLPPVLDAVRESLPIFLQAYSKPEYKLDTALIYGTQVENTDLFPSTAAFATEWNKQYTFPKLNYSTFTDFFRYVEKRYGNDLPTFKGDGGPYWEDGIGSDAYFASEDRQNQNRALSAEILSTVTHSIDPNLGAPAQLTTDIWRNIILFAEHTWLSYNSITQPDHEESIKQIRVKDARANTASLEIEDLMNRSLSQLADQIHIPAHTLVVFNSLSWQRDALVETDLLDGSRLTDLATGAQVPFQVVAAREKFLHVRFLARNLPAVGYKCFRIEHPNHPGDAPEPQETNDATVENSFYRITVDRASGALKSIFDKQLQRELVDSTQYKFGQYLYVTGGEGTRIINPYPSLPPAELTVHACSDGKLVGTQKLPWGYSIKTSCSTTQTPGVHTEILLPDNQKEIEFRYQVHKDYTTAKEAVYFAFPAAVSHPHFAFASQQGWVDPAKDVMKGGSLEWFTVQQWMAVQDSNVALGIVPLDAPLATFGDINRGRWPDTFQPSTGTIFSYAMNNYWDTNYRAGQGGEFTFRFVVTSSSAFDGGELTRLGLEETRPVEVNYVVGQDKVGDPPRPLSSAGTGFLESSAKNVALITWKQAEDGNGTILRMAETDGQGAEASLQFPHLNIISANLCSGTEDDMQGLPVDGHAVRLSFRPFQVLTIRVVSR